MLKNIFFTLYVSILVFIPLLNTYWFFLRNTDELFRKKFKKLMSIIMYSCILLLYFIYHIYKIFDLYNMSQADFDKKFVSTSIMIRIIFDIILLCISILIINDSINKFINEIQNIKETNDENTNGDNVENTNGDNIV